MGFNPGKSDKTMTDSQKFVRQDSGECSKTQTGQKLEIVGVHWRKTHSAFRDEDTFIFLGGVNSCEKCKVYGIG